MEVRRVYYGCTEEGVDIRYREVKRDHEGKIKEYRTIPQSPGPRRLKRADRMPVLVSDLKKYNIIRED